MAQRFRWGLVAVAAVLAMAIPPAVVLWKGNQASPSILLRYADFGFEPASPEARNLADGIARSGDNARSNFAIIDKKLAVIHVFDGAAHLRGSSPILLGSAPGDESVPGIGKRPIAKVRPEERTTPAGRFVVSRGMNPYGCINIPQEFFAEVVRPAMAAHRSVVYILPEEKTVEQVFGSVAGANRS